MKFNISAPSKVILFGEHSVVYGKLALAACVDLRTVLEIKPSENEYLELNFDALGVKKQWRVSSLKTFWDSDRHHFERYDSPSPISEDILRMILAKVQKQDSDGAPDSKELALVAFIFLYNVLVGEPKPFVFTVKSDAPVGAGLGSSASYSVVLAAGLWALGQKLNAPDANIQDLSKEVKEMISQWAYMCEKLFHGSPSGIDNSICTFGGVLSFQQGNIRHVSIPNGKLRILLVNSKVSRRTSDLVEKGRRRRDMLPSVMENVYDGLDSVAKDALAIIEKLEEGYDFEKLDELVEVCQHLLCAVGAGHPALDDIVRIAAKHGRRAKLTGAGGGGFAYVLLPPSMESEGVIALSKELQEAGYESWETTVGGQGVAIKCE